MRSRQHRPGPLRGSEHTHHQVEVRTRGIFGVNGVLSRAPGNPISTCVDRVVGEHVEIRLAAGGLGDAFAPALLLVLLLPGRRAERLLPELHRPHPVATGRIAIGSGPGGDDEHLSVDGLHRSVGGVQHLAVIAGTDRRSAVGLRTELPGEVRLVPDLQCLHRRERRRRARPSGSKPPRVARRDRVHEVGERGRTRLPVPGRRTTAARPGPSAQAGAPVTVSKTDRPARFGISHGPVGGAEVIGAAPGVRRVRRRRGPRHN